MSLYFDHAAATPVSELVLQAMLPYFSEKFYNPSATYLAGKAVRQDLEAARGRVAAVLGARKNEIVFTAGGTEANNLAIRGVMERFPEGTMIVSAIEHDSVLGPAQKHERHNLVGVDQAGIIDLAALERQINDTTVLVSVMYANNEIGSIQPIRRIAQLAATIRAERKQRGNTLPLYIHTDACQAANVLDLHVSRLGVDMMTLNGGKIYGPKQSGALYIGSHVQLRPQILGGGQERNTRSGTENVAFAIGLATALEDAQARRYDEAAKSQALQHYFMQHALKRIPEIQINGSRKHRLPSNIHITIPGTDNERLIFGLDEAGIQVAAGSACSAAQDTPSHVLRAIGLSDKDAQASLRFTTGRDTTEASIDTALEALSKLLYTKA